MICVLCTCCEKSAMKFVLDETHEPKAQSWVESANVAGSDFPIQNLPLVFSGGAMPAPQPAWEWRSETRSSTCKES